MSSYLLTLDDSLIYTIRLSSVGVNCTPTYVYLYLGGASYIWEYENDLAPDADRSFQIDDDTQVITLVMETTSSAGNGVFTTGDTITVYVNNTSGSGDVTTLTVMENGIIIYDSVEAPSDQSFSFPVLAGAEYRLSGTTANNL